MSQSFYVTELMVKERVNAALKEGLTSQAVNRSGAPKLSLFHGPQQLIQGFLNPRTDEPSISAVRGRRLASTAIRVAIAVTVLLILIYFG
jgi:hypothetical protein